MAFDPAAGQEGRVRLGGADTIIAGISEWRINKTVGEIPVLHFELPADADGIVWSAYEKGIANATLTFRGHYNVDATDKTEGGTPGIKVGATLSVDLLFTRTPFGYINVTCFVTQFNAGTNIDNQTASFDCTCRVSGAVGVAA